MAPTFSSAKARRVLAALEGIGSHRVLERDGWPDFVFAFHDGDEIGPRMLSRISKNTGLMPDDL